MEEKKQGASGRVRKKTKLVDEMARRGTPARGRGMGSEPRWKLKSLCWLRGTSSSYGTMSGESQESLWW